MSRVREDRDERALDIADTVATADLVEITTAVVVAVLVVNLQLGDGGPAPAFGVVLGAAKDIVLRRAVCNTTGVGVRGASGELIGKLAARVVLLEASDVSVFALAARQERRGLLGHGVTHKGEEVFLEGRVVGVHGPRR